MLINIIGIEDSSRNARLALSVAIQQNEYGISLAIRRDELRYTQGKKNV
jgi:hypothetical protein